MDPAHDVIPDAVRVGLVDIGDQSLSQTVVVTVPDCSAIVRGIPAEPLVEVGVGSTRLARGRDIFTVKIGYHRDGSGRSTVGYDVLEHIAHDVSGLCRINAVLLGACRKDHGIVAVQHLRICIRFRIGSSRSKGIEGSAHLKRRDARGKRTDGLCGIRPLGCHVDALLHEEPESRVASDVIPDLERDRILRQRDCPSYGERARI